MLRISQSQFEGLAEETNRRFLSRLVNLALELRPELGNRATPESLQQFADFSFKQAAAIGFASEFEIAVFCTAMLLLGRDFHVNPAHPMFEVVTRPETESRLRATQLLYELEKLAAQPTFS